MLPTWTCLVYLLECLGRQVSTQVATKRSKQARTRGSPRFPCQKKIQARPPKELAAVSPALLPWLAGTAPCPHPPQPRWLPCHLSISPLLMFLHCMESPSASLVMGLVQGSNRIPHRGSTTRRHDVLLSIANTVQLSIFAPHLNPINPFFSSRVFSLLLLSFLLSPSPLLPRLSLIFRLASSSRHLVSSHRLGSQLIPEQLQFHIFHPPWRPSCR